MNWLRKSGLSILLSIFLLLPNLGLSAPGNVQSQAGSHTIRLDASEAGWISKLSLKPLRSIDYGSFLWLELGESDFQSLRQVAGGAFTEVIAAGKVSVMGYLFDPLLEGEPQLPVGLRLDTPETGFHLVQFFGPVQDGWLDQVAASGADLLQYYPHNAYLVWATRAQVSQIESLGSVRWTGVFHPAYRLAPTLAGAQGRIENVAITFYNDGNLLATLGRIMGLGGVHLQHFPAQPDQRFYTAIFTLAADQLESVARIPAVWVIEYSSPRPAFDDEIGAQIIAGNHPGGNPVPGFYTWLQSKGVDGSGITWADVDTGLNASHPDLTGRAVAFVTYPGAPPANTDPDGHGTHTAGAIMADPRLAQGGTGITDPNNFYWGTGMAPESQLVVQNALFGTSWPPTGGWQVLSRDSVVNGAMGSSNSWFTGASGSQGYSSAARTHDLMVRDANFDTPAVAEPIVMVFSAGNGGPGPTTMTEPKEAKNLISVGASSNYPRSGASINDLANFSSRGPAQDGRLLPNVTAPGWQTASLNGTGATCGATVPGAGAAYYNYCSGTSMAAPFVSGSAALVADWWAGQGRGVPSPAMVKALLINGAADMVGGTGISGNIPNNNQGWGRTYLDEVIDPSVDTQYFDQQELFSATGQSWSINVAVMDLSKPLKISLVWSDAPGAVNANPALVNNLNLSVVNGGNTYFGNRFSNGWSIPGGSPDSLNNIENVYIQNPLRNVSLTVQAANIAGDGVPYNGDPTDQDFALVCYNCLYTGFTLSAAPDTQSVCAPDEAQYQVDVGQILNFQVPVTLAASVTPPAAVPTSFSANPVTPPGSSTLTADVASAVAEGRYSIDISGSTPTMTLAITVGLDVYAGIASPPLLLAPANGAVNLGVRPAFSWQAAALPVTYAIQVARDAAFTDIVASASGLSQPGFTPAIDLDTRTRYYWRVRTDNLCGLGSYSAAFTFSTFVSPGDCSVDQLPLTLYQQDFESGAPGWSHSGLQDLWDFSTARVHGGAYSMHATNIDTPSDQMLFSPPVSLPAGQSPLTLQFWNYQRMEPRTGGCYDGGILELSTDGGSSWAQLSAGLLTDPYNGPISSQYQNPLAGKNAWCGDPQDWLNSVVQLDAYAGQQVQFRFRLGTDQGGSREGWYIDDLLVQSCVAASHNADLSGDSTQAGLPGSDVTHNFTLTNLGLADTYSVTLSGGSWASSLAITSPVGLATGGSIVLPVQVEIPSQLVDVVLDSDVFTLTVTSQSDPGISLQATGTTQAVANPGVALTAVITEGLGLPGQTVTYTLMVSNTGEYTDTFTLSASGIWTATFDSSLVGPLGAGQSTQVRLHILVPASAALGDSDITTVTATSTLDGSAVDTAYVRTTATEVWYRLYLPALLR